MMVIATIISEDLLNLFYSVTDFLHRYNKNGVDLNRNFPDVFEINADREREKEVRAVMDWLKTESFVLSANLHGGAVVASYPYDNSNGGQLLYPFFCLFFCVQRFMLD